MKDFLGIVFFVFALFFFFNVVSADAIQPPASESGKLAMYQHIAEHYWHDKVPCAHFEWGIPQGHEGAIASAETPGCIIYLNSLWWRDWFPKWQCDAIVHEYGHLLGKEHTHDMGIMDPFHVGTIRACRNPAKGEKLNGISVNRRFRRSEVRSRSPE